MCYRPLPGNPKIMERGMRAVEYACVVGMGITPNVLYVNHDGVQQLQVSKPLIFFTIILYSICNLVLSL